MGSRIAVSNTVIIGPESFYGSFNMSCCAIISALIGGVNSVTREKLAV
jgi:hypothetical protein